MYCKGLAWAWLFSMARWENGTIETATGHIVDLKRGEILGAPDYLAQIWNWSPKAVRNFLDLLQRNGMIEVMSGGPLKRKDRGIVESKAQGRVKGIAKGTAKGTAPSIIRICNYEEKQTLGLRSEIAERTATGIGEVTNKGDQKGDTIINNKKTTSSTARATPNFYLNGTAIHVNGQVIGFEAIDQMATVCGVEKNTARSIVELAAQEWADKGENPPSVMATLKRALHEHATALAIKEQRIENERGRGSDRSNSAWIKA